MSSFTWNHCPACLEYAEALLKEEDNNLPRFYERVRTLAATPYPERKAALNELQRANRQESLATQFQQD